MDDEPTLTQRLRQQGISRRSFLKYCAGLASMMALPPALAPKIAEALERARRPAVIWLSFQECTACTESLTRSFSPTIENLIFNVISLDYHHTLQAASGTHAEEARRQSMAQNKGRYILVVDGSIPVRDGGVYSTIAGISNLDMLRETAADAAAIVSVGTCASYGGLPHARPNPTGAVPVSEILPERTIVHVPGCPPIPVVISGVIAHVLTFGKLPELDDIGRPKMFYGQTIHDRCYRRPFYDRNLFAESFDDEGARQGWCLYKLGCKGPTTRNACATEKWNQGTSFPIQSGHPCLGCSEPDFWDAGSFYQALTAPPVDVSKWVAPAVATGVVAGAAIGLANRLRRAKAARARQPLTADDVKTED
ncbi:MAG TPA: twin-arginine translocation signal domain-containing protein [Gammaproteobacteria bacterium]|nr:twin-arginine translocation signal domain-containing protein [Gammaproteobacteria bacterium]